MAGSSSVLSASRTPSLPTFSAFIKKSFSAGKNVNGPPPKRSTGDGLYPLESVVSVCKTTALNTEATMSSRAISRLSKFCTSVLAKTPHREAMG